MPAEADLVEHVRWVGEDLLRPAIGVEAKKKGDQALDDEGVAVRLEL